MLKKGEHVEGTPVELEALLAGDETAKAFFESLSKGYKQGYCDWVGSAKQEESRHVRAAKALIMLQKGQKTLKTELTYTCLSICCSTMFPGISTLPIPKRKYYTLTLSPGKLNGKSLF